MSATDDAATLTLQQIEAARAALMDLDPRIDSAERSAAAQTLWTSAAVEAVTALAEALRSGRVEVMLPVLNLIAADPAPRRELLQPTLDALVDAVPDVEPALHAALMSYGEAGLNAVARIAGSSTATADQRLRAIRCLGGFVPYGPSCVEHLLALLDPARKEPQPILDATCDSLALVTQMPWGRDPSAWREWWTAARTLPLDAWAPTALRNVSGRLSDLQTRHDQLARRYVSALRELFVRLPLEQQLATLPPLLGDDTMVVREFALDRVGRLLRDSERVPPEIQALLVRRLDAEPSGRLRLQAATLLNELNVDDLSPWLQRAIASETRASVAAGLFQLLADRHEPAPATVISRWLMDESAGEPAASTAWFMMRGGSVADDDLGTLRHAVAEAFDLRTTPAIVRLMALTCGDDRLPEVESLLVDQAEAIRRAAAEGLRARGRTEPLIARAADPAVFVHAVEALVEGEPTLNAFTALAQLEPAQPDARQLWSGAIVRLAHRLPVAALLPADNILKARNVELSVRSQALARAVDAASTQGELLPTTLVACIAEIRLDQDDANGALQVLAPHATTDDPTLIDLRFDSLLLLARYDEAEQIRADPVVWIAAMDRVTRRRPDLIGAVRDEILDRFRDTLTDDQRSALRQTTAEGRGAASADDPTGAERPG